MSVYLGVQLEDVFNQIKVGKITDSKVKGSMMSTVDTLIAESDKHDFASMEEHLKHCAFVVRPLMDEVRSYADALEAEVSDECWPLPSYEEMLFIK